MPDSKILGLIGAVSVILAGLITNVPSVHAALKTPLRRSLAAGLLAGAFAAAGLFIARLAVHAN